MVRMMKEVESLSFRATQGNRWQIRLLRFAAVALLCELLQVHAPACPGRDVVVVLLVREI